MFNHCKSRIRLTIVTRWYSNEADTQRIVNKFGHRTYEADSWTNIPPWLQSCAARTIYLQKDHPLAIVRKEITSYFNKAFVHSNGTPIFSAIDDIDPVLAVKQNSTIHDDPSPSVDIKSGNQSKHYYLNEKYMLRSHLGEHHSQILASGLTNYSMTGELFRATEIKPTLFPIVHQMDIVRVLNRNTLFAHRAVDPHLQIFEDNPIDLKSSKKNNPFDDLQNMPLKQPCHTLIAAKLAEHDLKQTLDGLIRHIFGENADYQIAKGGVPTSVMYPSFKLRLYREGRWVDVFRSGIIRNEILDHSDIKNSIGWRIEMILEHVAMMLFNIPDIQVFWSRDDAILSQFRANKPISQMQYKPIINSEFQQSATAYPKQPVQNLKEREQFKPTSNRENKIKSKFHNKPLSTEKDKSQLKPFFIRESSFALPSSLTPEEFPVNEFRELVTKIVGESLGLSTKVKSI